MMIVRGMKSVLLGAAALWMVPAAAADLALVIVNTEYETAADRPEDSAAAGYLADALNARGYEVYEALDARMEDLQPLIAGLAARLGEADRLVIFYAGHTLHDEERAWAVPVEMAEPGRVEAAFGALDLSLLLDLAGQVPGRSLVAIGTDDAGFETAEALLPLDAGLGALAAPQGVALVSGPVAPLVEVLTDAVLVEGVTLAEALAAAPEGIAVSGFLSPDAGFAMPIGATPDAETALWLEARRANTVERLEAYLAAHPQGRHAEEARRLIAAQQAAAVDPAEAAEQALALDQAARRRIQQQLTVLGQNTRGIDGIFGPGTRAAIAAWQRTAGFEPSGFLDAAQLDRLEAQAATREAELAAEAERKRREEETADAAFWQATGANGGSADLRAYLGRYPEGIYAAEARAALDRLDQADREAAAAEDRAYWDQVRAADTVEAYRAYLDRYPQGAFAELAEERIADLTGAPEREEAERAARAAEEALGLNAASRSLIEGQLAAIGYDPGRVDGQFDEDARRAIRQFQSRQGLEVTGYVSQEMMRALIVASLGLR
jgi:peptidoglycan hydrolase-like protein with peptidoglycan-binding domain